MVAGRLSNLKLGHRKDYADAPIGASAVAQDEAASMLNVSRRSAQRARVVLDKAAPELVSAVDRGEVAVAAAAEVATLPKPEQAAIVKRGSAEVRIADERRLTALENRNTVIIMTKTLTGQGGPGRGQGRKPLPDGEAMVPVTVKMQPAQREKLQRLGGASWVRNRIDRAKEPK